MARKVVFLNKIFVFTCLFLFFSQIAMAKDKTFLESPSPYDLKFDFERKRGVFWAPALSFLMPGFDQIGEEQYNYAARYSGLALGGLAIGLIGLDGEDLTDTEIDTENDSIRLGTLGFQFYSVAGSLSAYHSFRSAVRSRKPHGEYKFLKHEETAKDIFMAPLKFKLLKRPSVWIPLTIEPLLLAYFLKEDKKIYFDFSGSDLFFTSAFSFNAGTHEEALFRGWMMPVMQEKFDSSFWANFTQGLLFGLAHLSTDNKVPLPQFLMGLYLGYRTMANEWKLEESIFIHTWWDILAIGSIYAFQANRSASVFVPLYLTSF